MRCALLTVALSLSACGSGLCDDSPLGNTCEHVEGRWILEAGNRDSRCGATLFEGPLIITSSKGGKLAGWASSARMFGKLYPGGVYELSSSAYGFQVDGSLQQAPETPDKLLGAVTFSDDHLGCERHWQFVAHRE